MVCGSNTQTTSKHTNLVFVVDFMVSTDDMSHVLVVFFLKVGDPPFYVLQSITCKTSVIFQGGHHVAQRHHKNATVIAILTVMGVFVVALHRVFALVTQQMMQTVRCSVTGLL